MTTPIARGISPHAHYSWWRGLALAQTLRLFTRNVSARAIAYESCWEHDIIWLVYPPIRTWEAFARLRGQANDQVLHENHQANAITMSKSIAAMCRAPSRQSQWARKPSACSRVLLCRHDLGSNARRGMLDTPPSYLILGGSCLLVPPRDAVAIRIGTQNTVNFNSRRRIPGQSSFARHTLHVSSSNHPRFQQPESVFLDVQVMRNPHSSGTRVKSFAGVAVSSMQALHSGMYGSVDGISGCKTSVVFARTHTASSQSKHRA
jgi:hypothetical protein